MVKAYAFPAQGEVTDWTKLSATIRMTIDLYFKEAETYAEM